MNNEERKKRQWWVVAEGDVRNVTGYSCEPNNPGMWWCPEVGFSASEKHHIFETELEALHQAIEEHIAAMRKSHDRYLRLNERRRKLE